MDLNAVLLNYGTLVEAGNAEFHWNYDGTLSHKELFADAAKKDLIYSKYLFWNRNGTLREWIINVATTGERIVKTFRYDCDDNLIGSEITTC